MTRTVGDDDVDDDDDDAVPHVQCSSEVSTSSGWRRSADAGR